MSSYQELPALHFRDLPAEVRNLIYTFALVDDAPISLPRGYEKKALAEPGLLLTSKWIRCEAAAIYYGCNTFAAPSTPSAQKFLKSLRPENIAQLRYFQAVDSVLTAAANKRWFTNVSRNINGLVNPHGKRSLSPDAILLPVDTLEGVMWYRLRDIEDFQILSTGAQEWKVQWCGDEPSEC